MAGASLVRGEDGALREPPGHAALWGFFGLSYASWLTLPRVMMHEMPDDWQLRMAQLLQEFHQVYEWPEEIADIHVQVRNGRRFGALPEWLEYKHPDVATIESFKRAAPDQQEQPNG